MISSMSPVSPLFYAIETVRFSLSSIGKTLPSLDNEMSMLVSQVPNSLSHSPCMLKNDTYHMYTYIERPTNSFVTNLPHQVNHSF